MTPAVLRVRLSRATLSGAGVHWLCYAALVATLIAYYLVVLTWGTGLGVDFACFRAAALVTLHGGNPYELAQLWRAENALYNVPRHLHPGAPSYYYPEGYYNPPLFATALIPLVRLPFGQGYALYAAAVVALAAAGSWLLLQALGWTRLRAPATAIVLVSPSVFLAVRNGQQSTLLLCALGAALYALRRGKPGLAGALLAVGWVKPHLLVPFALLGPWLLPEARATIRWYAGFLSATALGVALTVLTSGAGSIAAWRQALVHRSGFLGGAHASLPSLSGVSLDLLPHPWDKILAAAVTALGLGVMVAVVVRGRRVARPPWAGLGMLVATWLLVTPYVQANDDVLLLLPLAVAWGCNGARGLRRPLPLLFLWAFTALPLAFLLPRPISVLTALPAALAFGAVLAASHDSHSVAGEG